MVDLSLAVPSIKAFGSKLLKRKTFSLKGWGVGIWTGLFITALLVVCRYISEVGLTYAPPSHHLHICKHVSTTGTLITGVKKVRQNTESVLRF